MKRGAASADAKRPKRQKREPRKLESKERENKPKPTTYLPHRLYPNVKPLFLYDHGASKVRPLGVLDVRDQNHEVRRSDEDRVIFLEEPDVGVNMVWTVGVTTGRVASFSKRADLCDLLVEAARCRTKDVAPQPKEVVPFRNLQQELVTGLEADPESLLVSGEGRAVLLRGSTFYCRQGDENFEARYDWFILDPRLPSSEYPKALVLAPKPCVLVHTSGGVHDRVYNVNYDTRTWTLLYEGAINDVLLFNDQLVIHQGQHLYLVSDQRASVLDFRKIAPGTVCCPLPWQRSSSERRCSNFLAALTNENQPIVWNTKFEIVNSVTTWLLPLPSVRVFDCRKVLPNCLHAIRMVGGRLIGTSDHGLCILDFEPGLRPVRDAMRLEDCFEGRPVAYQDSAPIYACDVLASFKQLCAALGSPEFAITERPQSSQSFPTSTRWTITHEEQVVAQLMDHEQTNLFADNLPTVHQFRTGHQRWRVLICGSSGVQCSEHFAQIIQFLQNRHIY